jgi:ribonuclease P protein component
VRTIRSNREIDALFREGVRVSAPVLVVMTRATHEGRGPGGRVAFVAGKKLGNAVKRNRSKRVLRAAAGRAGAPWAGYDVVLIARPATATASAASLDEALERGLRKAGVRP